MPVMFDGRIFRVASDMTTQNDDYYVVYKEGVWVETLAGAKARYRTPAPCRMR
jgi:hypothetical protein